jgi:hypothetical protein
MQENIKECGDDLDFALGRVSEEDRLAILIQRLKTDEAVLPANLGGPIRSALGREEVGPLDEEGGLASFSLVIGNAVGW